MTCALAPPNPNELIPIISPDLSSKCDVTGTTLPSIMGFNYRIVTVQTINKQVFKYLLTDAVTKLNGHHQGPIMGFHEALF